MIPPQERREVLSVGSKGSTEFRISMKDQAHLMGVLRKTLYSDKVMAVLREYASNAWDANREAGRGDVPIQVTLPTLDEPVLKIRDCGPGLSVDDVEFVFSQYGASTKRGANTAVGMLGIGSKAGFAYSDSFTVVSHHGGVKRTYVAALDESEKGRIDLLHEEPSDEMGVEIQVAVRPQDIGEFEERAKRLFVHFTPQPRINCQLGEAISGREIPGLGTVNESKNAGKQWVAVMGCVPYLVDLAQLSGEIDGHSLSPRASRHGGLLPFDIGELQFAASREHLEYVDKTRLALIKRINELLDEYVRTMLDGFDELSGWEQRLRIRAVDSLNLPVPKHLKKLDELHVGICPESILDPETGKNVLRQPRTFKLMRFDTWRQRLMPSSALYVDRDTKLLLRDTPRGIKGYGFSSNSPTIVVPLDAEIWEVKEELEAILKRNTCDGVPITKMSSLPWTKPASSGFRDVERAKAKCFVFDFTAHRRKHPSLGWLPTEHVQTDDDVFVILERYHPRGFVEGSFIDQYREDRELLAQIGKKMPTVIGYKSTQKDRASSEDFPGMDYGTWRRKKLPELLLQDPKVREAVEMCGFYSLKLDARSLPLHLLEQRLGPDHWLSKAAAEIEEGRQKWFRLSYEVHQMANFVKHRSGKAQTRAGEIEERLAAEYPLLAVSGLPVLVADHKELWIDYIRLADRSGKMASADDGQEEAA